jgi:selenocysteine lyase/cysteine desulfurase
VLIDGAHALGMLPVNLQQLQPDFYVSNCHKWLCGTRGSAVMYVSRQWQQYMQPPVLSHGAQAGFLSRFIWDGCRDYAPLLAISSAVKWWKGLGAAAAGAAAGSGGSVITAAAAAAAAAAETERSCCNPSILAHAGDGGAAARCYMYRLLRQAADFLAAEWGTGCLGPTNMTAAMTLVRLPEGGALPAVGAATSADAKYIQVRCVLAP